MGITGSDRNGRRATVLLLSLALAGGCASTSSLETLPPDQRNALLTTMQASDLRVANIAYKLASAGEPLCPRKAAIVGITLHEPAQYAPALREAAGNVMRLGNRVAILAVATGSPADMVGLQAGDGLVTIGGRPVTPTPRGSRGVYAGVATAYAQLAQSAAAGPLDLVVERRGRPLRIAVTPATGCVSQVQLLPSPRIHAKADGRHLSVTTALVDYVANDDELALVMAHEMAHNALGHRAQFEAQGVRRGLFGSYGANAAKVLAAERAADRLGYFLMARAGFDPSVAFSFWPRLYAGPAGERSTVTTHPDQAMRTDDARRAIADISAARHRGQPPTP